MIATTAMIGSGFLLTAFLTGLSGFTFDGAYTNVIGSGDGDYLTKDTLWELKVSKNELSNKTYRVESHYKKRGSTKE